ncbi:MAG: ATP-binding protein [Candidatus Methylomirabilales bacterium]
MDTTAQSSHLTRALSSAAVALGRTRDAEEVVRVAIAETQRATGIEAVALHLVDPAGEALILRQFAGTTPSFREQVERLPLSQAQIAARAIRERRVMACGVEAHPAESLRDIYAAQGFRHVTVVPVEGREEVLGVLHLASRDEPALGPDGLALVQAIGGLVGVALENAALREALAAQRDRLRALAEATLRAREEEARRIAHELHDEAGQLLASVHIALDQLGPRILEHAETVRRLHELLDRVEGQLRRLSRELRPTVLDDLGLAPALEWLTQGMAERAGITIRVQAPVGRLPAPVETALYRIVQEALSNAVRHARAGKVEVEVSETDHGVEAVVRDDGRGFDAAAAARAGDRGLGLLGMRERAESLGGKLTVQSAPGAGTRLAVRIPLDRPA